MLHRTKHVYSAEHLPRAANRLAMVDEEPLLSREADQFPNQYMLKVIN